jgi:hypothetical protein
LQGATDAQGFMARLDTLFQMMEHRKMDKVKSVTLLSGLLLGLSSSGAADVNGDMNNFFNKLGFASNTPAAGLAGAGRGLRLGRFAVCQNAGENHPAGQHDPAGY